MSVILHFGYKFSYFWLHWGLLWMTVWRICYMKRTLVCILQNTYPVFSLFFSFLVVLARWLINHQSWLFLDAADICICGFAYLLQCFYFQILSCKGQQSGCVLIKAKGDKLSFVYLFYVDILIFSVCIHCKVIRYTISLKFIVIKIWGFILILNYNWPMRICTIWYGIWYMVYGIWYCTRRI